MSFLNGLLGGGNSGKKDSASIAKDRLKVIVATNARLNRRLHPEQIEIMKKEVLEVVNKFVSGVSMDDVTISQRQEDNTDILEMNVNLPDRQ